MKSTKSALRLLPLILLLFVISAMKPVYGAYNIALSWEIGINPMVFSIAGLIDGDLADAGDLEFGDIDPFFNVMVTGTGEEDNLYLWVRFVSGSNDVIFSVRSELVSVEEALLNRPHNNYTLGLSPINLGAAGGINEELALSIVDNSLVRDGFYRLTVALTTESAWENDAQIYDNNEGIATMSIHVQNPSQIRILQPNDGAELHANPMFIWRFPRQEGVTFDLDLVRGEADQTPAEAMDSPAEANVFLSTTLSHDDFIGEGVNIYVYTGIGEQRQLEDGTYFWQVSATVPGAFPGEWFTYESPIQSFDYLSPGGGGGDGGGGGGGDPFGGGEGGEQDPPPQQYAEIFTVLQNILPEDLIRGLFQLFGNLEDWEVESIIIEDREVNLQQLIRFFLSGNRTVVMVSVS